jgi:hypothetical protein
MATAVAALPPGFELDQPAPGKGGLPPGFELDAPHASPAPKNYDPWPADKPPPDGFHVIKTNGAPYIVHDFGVGETTRALSDLPGVGMAERFGQGAVRLAGKAASGIFGLFGRGNPDTVHGVQDAVNATTELPPSNDPLVQGMDAVGNVVNKVAAPVDRAVGDLPPALRTGVEATEEAAPDIASVLGLRAPAAATGARVAAESGEAPVASAVEAARGRTPPPEPRPIDATDVTGALQEAGYRQLPRQNPNSTLPQRVGASIVGEGSLAQKQTLTDQAATDELARNEAEILPGQELNTANAEAAATNGPGKVYNAVQAALPPVMTKSEELLSRLNGLEDTTSEVPQSDKVGALRTSVTAAPTITREGLFQNIQAMRAKATRYYAASDKDPDAAEIGDAYMHAANAYEDFAEQELGKVPDAGVTVDDFRDARTRFAKNYAVRAALNGTSVDAAKIARMHQSNPGQMTGGLQLIAEQHSRFPLSTGFGPRTLAPDGIGASGTVPGIVARHVTGPAIGAGTALMLGGGPTGAAIGGAAGLLTSEAFQSALRRWLGGSPETAGETAAGAATNPRLGNFFGGDQSPPPGWNRDSGPHWSTGEGANPNAPNPQGGQGDVPLADVLSHGVEQGPPESVSAGPMGAPPQEGLTFRGSPDAVGARPVQGGSPQLRRVTDDYGSQVYIERGNNPGAQTETSPVEGRASGITLGDRHAGGAEPPLAPSRGTVGRFGDVNAATGSEGRVSATPIGDLFHGPNMDVNLGPIAGQNPEFGPGVPGGDLQRAETSRAGEVAQGDRPGLEDVNVSRYGIRGAPKFPYEGPRPTGKPRWTGKGPEPEEPEPFDPNTPPKRPSGGGGAGQMNREAILGDLMDSWFNDRKSLGGPTPRASNFSFPGAAGAASDESISRGSRNLIETNGDNANTVSRGVDQIDLAPKKGHVFIDADTGKLVDSGGMSARQAQSVLNRFKARKTLADELEPTPQ